MGEAVAGENRNFPHHPPQPNPRHKVAPQPNTPQLLPRRKNKTSQFRQAATFFAWISRTAASSTCMLDTQYFNVNDPTPYDDTGWTFGPLRNVKTQRITDATILKAPMTLITGDARAQGGVTGAGGDIS